MTDRPILFSGPMVLEILPGRKTQTRRVIRPQFMSQVSEVRINASGEWCGYASGEPGIRRGWRRCPYGAAGNNLWCREASIIAPQRWNDDAGANCTDAEGVPRLVQYLATDPDTEAARGYGLRIRPSIFMPRWASRITLEVTGVRVERLQDCSEPDAVAEGMLYVMAERGAPSPLAAFRIGWDEINGKRPGCSWEANPWVWVVSFRRLP